MRCIVESDIAGNSVVELRRSTVGERVVALLILPFTAIVFSLLGPAVFFSQ